MRHMRVDDLEQATQTLNQVFCPHRLSIASGSTRISTQVEVAGMQHWPVVKLRYGAAVEVDAGEFPNLFLIMRCLDGHALAKQNNVCVRGGQGVTLPLSGDLPTRLSFDREFSQLSVKLDKAKLVSLCSNLLGHPLDQPLKFELRPFSVAMEHAWTSLLTMIETHQQFGRVLPAATADALEAYMLTLLLRGHQHNYSEAVNRPDGSAQSHLVRRAEMFIKQNAETCLSVADLAAKLGTSIRTLQVKFKEELDQTPVRYLRRIKLGCAREALLNADSLASVTDVAFACGFLHLGRFGHDYRQTYGEFPAVTLSRARRR